MESQNDQEQISKLFVNKIVPVTHHQQRIYQTQNEVADEIEILDESKTFDIRRPISVLSIKGKPSYRFEYLASTLSQAAKEIYQTIGMTFSLDKIDLGKVTKNIAPVALSAITFASAEYFSKQLCRILSIDENFSQIFKFMFSAAIFRQSFSHRVTETQIESLKEYAFLAALDILAIGYLYSSTYTGSFKLFNMMLPEGYAFLASLAMSGIAIPGAIASFAQKDQQKKLIKQYNEGAQRSDTALISTGLTPVSNTYLQANRLLISELSSVSRIFQLGLISNNIISDRGLERQFRNLPSIVIDVVPQLLRKLFIQLKKIDEDYHKNTSPLFVLKNQTLTQRKRHELKTGDYVWCGDKFDFSMVPVSGDIVALERIDESKFDEKKESTHEYRVNLKTYSGENIWIKNTASQKVYGDFKEIDQRAIQDKKQLAILDGAQIDFLGSHENFFIRVGRKKELLLDSSYEKKSVINQIINQSKQNNINYAVATSFLMSLYLGGSALTVASQSIVLLFSLFQMMIPFSEAFLREMINSRMLKDFNAKLNDYPIEMIDALRIVDFLNAINTYYADKFPRGVAIVSDKTGTLTTTTMKALGLWTKEMKTDIQVLPHSHHKQKEIFEIFAAAFTNSELEIEPEEHAILDLFKENNEACLTIDTIAKNHFKKKLQLNDYKQELETIHLGLFTSFGGRFTIVNDGSKKSLVFCGIPRQAKFEHGSLLQDYNQMKTRYGVLSRDWCIAVADLKEAEYQDLKKFFELDDRQAIENCLTSQLMQKLRHVSTFLVNNLVKDHVEHFIPNFSKINVPVIIATGDTAKAAENIARVLCGNKSKNIITIKSHDVIPEKIIMNDSNTTVIFSGINHEILSLLDYLLLDKIYQPAIIFSEMTTKNKGELASYLKEKGYFVVANGDGTNDIEMMKISDFVIGHLSKEGKYAPGISQYINLNDRQVQKLFQTDDSFYQLFDVHLLERSYFMNMFLPLANAQEMVTYALIFKTIKMSLELAKSLGFLEVKEIWNQQWLSIVFDLIWLWIAYHKINEHAYLPVNDVHLAKSWLPLTCLFITIGIASMEAALSYYLFGRTTDISLILMTLAIMPTLLSSFFTGYSHVEHEIKPLEKPNYLLNAKPTLLIEEVKTEHAPVVSTACNPFSFVKSLFKKNQSSNSVLPIREESKKTACVIS